MADQVARSSEDVSKRGVESWTEMKEGGGRELIGSSEGAVGVRLGFALEI